jgi:hypothetical protein
MEDDRQGICDVLFVVDDEDFVAEGVSHGLCPGEIRYCGYYST